MRFEEGVSNSAFSLPASFNASQRLGCRRHGSKRCVVIWMFECFVCDVVAGLETVLSLAFEEKYD